MYTHTNGNIYIRAVLATSPVRTIGQVVRGRSACTISSRARCLGCGPTHGTKASMLRHCRYLPRRRVRRISPDRPDRQRRPVTQRQRRNCSHSSRPGVAGNTARALHGCRFRWRAYTTKTFLKNDREVVVKPARGTAKAYVFAFENPECAIKVAWTVFPDSKPSKVNDTKALADATLALKTQLEDSKPEIPGLWRSSTPQQIELHTEVLVSSGVIKANIPRSELWTDSLLEEANAFDPEIIKQQTRTCDLSKLNGS
jgi:hypothetical protein